MNILATNNTIHTKNKNCEFMEDDITTLNSEPLECTKNGLNAVYNDVNNVKYEYSRANQQCMCIYRYGYIDNVKTIC